MARNRHKIRRVTDPILVLFSGLGVGVLIGLSVSPTLYIIVASVMSVVVGASAALAGLEITHADKPTEQDIEPVVSQFRKRVPRIDPLPITTLMVGLAIGACGGIYLRTNKFFGPNPKRLAQAWTGTGIEEKDIEKRIFDQTYPPIDYSSPPPSAADESDAGADKPERQVLRTKQPPLESRTFESSESKSRVSSLYTGNETDCQLVSSKPDEESLRAALGLVSNRRIRELAEECKDEPCLRRLKDFVCRK